MVPTARRSRPTPQQKEHRKNGAPAAGDQCGRVPTRPPPVRACLPCTNRLAAVAPRQLLDGQARGSASRPTAGGTAGGQCTSATPTTRGWAAAARAHPPTTVVRAGRARPTWPPATRLSRTRPRQPPPPRAHRRHRRRPTPRQRPAARTRPAAAAATANRHPARAGGATATGPRDAPPHPNPHSRHRRHGHTRHARPSPRRRPPAVDTVAGTTDAEGPARGADVGEWGPR